MKKEKKIRPETVNLPEENIGKKLIDTGLRKDLLNLMPEAQTKVKIDKWGDAKLKSFCTAR